MRTDAERKEAREYAKERRHALVEKGFVYGTYALSPRACFALRTMQDTLGVSRAATLNTILERIANDANLRQELLAVST